MKGDINICETCGKSFEVKRNDYSGRFCNVKCSGQRTKTKFVINNFSENSPFTNYFGGFLFGDGCISGDLFQVGLSNLDDGSNDELLTQLSNYIYGQDLVYRYDTVIKLTGYDEKLVKNLKRFGIIDKKSHNGTIEINKKYHKDIIRGYFDADGWVTLGYSPQKWMCAGKQKKKYYPRISYGLCSYLEENLHIVNSWLPVKGCVTKKKTQELYELRFQNLGDALTVRDYIYYEDCVCLRRKREKFWSISDYFQEEYVPRKKTS